MPQPSLLDSDPPIMDSSDADAAALRAVSSLPSSSHPVSQLPHHPSDFSFPAFSFLLIHTSVIGLGLLILCCLCAAQRFSRRRNTQGANPDAYASPGVPIATGGMYQGPGVGYTHGGAAAYGPVSFTFSAVELQLIANFQPL